MEGEAAFKLNLHPKVTFDKSKTTYGSDVEFQEVCLMPFRKSPKILNLIFSSMRTNGRHVIQTSLVYMATSLLSRLIRRILQKKRLAGPKRKTRRIRLEV
jgi:hypothetical protein